MSRVFAALFAMALVGGLVVSSSVAPMLPSLAAATDGGSPSSALPPASPEAVVYSTDFEAGPAGWDASGLWHPVVDGVDEYGISHSPATSWWYGVDATGNYNNGTRNWGALTSPYISIPSSGIITLAWWEWQRMDDYAGTDIRTVRVLDGGKSYVLATMDNRFYVSTWTMHQADLTTFRGRTVRVSFDFDSIDGDYNNLRGWYVDDVAISSEPVAETGLPIFKGVASAYDLGDGGIALEWNASMDFALSYPITYEIYRATASRAEDLVWPTATYTSYDLPGDVVVWVDRDVEYDVEYYYVVRARDACWNRETNTKEVHARALDLTPPSFSGLAVAEDTGSVSIRLSWPAATDPQGSTPITYRIYRALASGAQDFGAPLASFTPAPGSPVEWINTGVTPGTTYYYVVRASDSFGNQESNYAEASASAQLRWWMQTEAPGIPGFLNLTSEPLGAGTETAVGPLDAPGDYLVGGVAWLSRPMDDTYESGGLWRFRVTGRMTTPNARGRLYANVSVVGMNGTRPLFSTALDDEDVALFPDDHVFAFSHDAAQDVVLPGERIAVELRLAVSSAVAGNDAALVPNPNFDTGSQNWTYYDLMGNKYNYDYWSATGGYPGGWCGVEFTGPKNGKSIAECGGLQSCRFYYDNSSFRPTLRFNYACLDYQLVEICMFFVAFISRVDGNLTIGPQVFIREVNSVTPWTDSGNIPIHQYLNESGIYFIKLTVWANGLGRRAHALGGYDNVRISWENLTTLFVMSFDSSTVTTDVLPSLRLAGKPPVASAGADVSGPVNLTAELSASGTTETDGDAVNYTWRFSYDGADVELYGANPSFTFSLPGTYNVTLTASDADGESSDVVVVTAYNTAPLADAGLPVVTAPGFSATLYGDGSYDPDGHALSYLWTFVYDGSSVEFTGAVPTFPFVIEGNYTATLTVSDWWGATSTDTTWVLVRNLPPVADAGSDVYGVAPFACVFDGGASDDPDGHALNLTWTFACLNATVVLYGPSPSFTFAAIGNYTVTLTVTDGYGGSSSDSVVVAVCADLPPVADAGVDVEVDQHQTVIFNGTASYDSSGISSYEWRFVYAGATVVLSGPTPSFLFDDAGVYAVTLIVTDGTGLADSDSITVGVRDTTAPSTVPISDVTVTPHTTVTFNSSGSADNVGIAFVMWSFDYGGTWIELYGEVQAFLFDEMGTYYVTLTVGDATGNTASRSFRVYVVDAIAPVADAGADIYALEHEAVSFDGTASHDDGGIANYTWTFSVAGAPFSLYGPSPSFTFDACGDYTVTLSVLDYAGLASSDSVVVHVADNTPPVADAGDDAVAELGVAMAFDGSGSHDNAGVVAYWWNFTDGSFQSLSGESPTYAFADLGAHLVTLTVVDAVGLSSTDSVWVTVSDTVAPVASAGLDVSSYVGWTVAFDASLSYDASGEMNYTWTFTHLNSTVVLYGPAPTFVFAEGGSYLVTLVVSDPSGNVATDTAVVTVEAPDLSPPSLSDATAAGPFPNDAPLALECQAWDDRSVDEVWVEYDTPVASANASMAEGMGGVWYAGIAPASLWPGTVEYGFWAFDGANWAYAGPFTRLVYDAVAPTSVAGLDITALAGEPVALAGAGSHDDVGIVNWTWHVTGPGTDLWLFGAAVSFTPGAAGAYAATLAVADAEGNVGYDSLAITVVPFTVGISYSLGWNLVSIPVCPDFGLLMAAFSDEWWNVLDVQWYDSSSGTWRVYSSTLPAWMNSLQYVDPTMGLWVNFAGGDGILEVSGARPSTTDIQLREGWNLVGFPSLDAGRSYADVLAGSPWDAIQVQDSFEAYMLRDALPTEIVAPGAGFWVHVTADAVVTVPW